MSSPQIHLRQVYHNKQLAKWLFRFHLPFKDWIVTICFYTAIHLAEALFYFLRPLGKQHSETSKPSSFQGGMHGWRARLINHLVTRGFLTKQFYKSYKNFNIQSNISRYLIKPIARSRYIPLNIMGDDYFSNKDIKDFLNIDLAILENEAHPHLSNVAIPADSRYTLLAMIRRMFSR